MGDDCPRVVLCWEMDQAAEFLWVIDDLNRQDCFLDESFFGFDHFAEIIVLLIKVYLNAGFFMRYK